MPNAIYGIAENDDLKPGILKKDTRSAKQKFKDFLLHDMGMIVQVAGLMLVAGSFFQQVPYIHDAVLLAILILFWMNSRIKIDYDFYAPATQKGKGGVISPKEGMFFLSNNLYKGNTEAWIPKELATTHWIVFGSTGSGKTRFLLGVFYQVAMYGGGCIYVDGKGDNTVWWLFYSMARKVGREEDVLLMNYLTGGGKIDKNTRISNTCNPFTMGNANQLASIVVGLMRDGGGDDMWKGRAIAMLKAVMESLVDKRDRNEIELNIEEIRNHLTLDKIIHLSQEENLGAEAAKNIMHYLEELPGFKMDDMFAGKLNPECYKQHGFLQMQLTEVMGDLSSTYKHIYGGKHGEIDFTDVIFQKRLLFVILPALEKNPDELAGLGKMVVANIRGALAPALGFDVEGNRVDVLESKPTNAEIPFTIILDEYGYYAVEGFAVVAAQARSLGVQVIYAGQDYPSLKKGSEIEAQATIANTNIKIAMKIEDMQDTADLFVQRAGEGDITVKSGDESKDGLLGGYKEQDTTRIERRKRIDGRDLVNQAPGQAHVLVKDTLERVQLFYAEPVETENIQINRFVPIKRIGNDAVNEIRKSKEKIANVFDGTVDIAGIENNDETIKNLFKWARMAGSYDLDMENRMQFTIGANLTLSTIDDLDEEEKILPAKESVESNNRKTTSGDADRSEKKSTPKVPKRNNAQPSSGTEAATSHSEAFEDKPRTEQDSSHLRREEANKAAEAFADAVKKDADTQRAVGERSRPGVRDMPQAPSEPKRSNAEQLDVISDGDDHESNRAEQARAAEDSFIALLDEAIYSNLSKKGVEVNENNKDAYSTRGQIDGSNHSNAKDTEDTINELKGISKRYPAKPTPPKPKQKDLEDHLNWIIKHLKADDLK